jgi:hypothetical protein
MKDEDDEENFEIFRYSESQADQYTRDLLDICLSISKCRHYLWRTTPNSKIATPMIWVDMESSKP